MAIKQIRINGDGFTNTTLNSVSSLFYEVTQTTKMYTDGKDLWSYGTTYNDWSTIFDNNIMKIEINNGGTGSLMIVRVSYMGSVVASGSYYGAYIGLAFAIDNSTEQGQIFACYYTAGDQQYHVECLITSSETWDLQTAYLAITGSEYAINGGGASHVAKTTGLLANLSENVSDILIVAGGGGGVGIENATPGNGGGYVGGSPKYNNVPISGKSGTQSTGYAFGRGEGNGGGGGFYGGFAGQTGVSGSGSGSGYIGNPLLTGDKRMYGNNVPTSTSSETYTLSNSLSSSNPISKYAKIGNGHVKFTYLRYEEPTIANYFFKPTFETGADGHDTIRYNTSDQVNILYDLSEFYVWDPYIANIQPNKAYSGQLIDTNWATWPDTYSESQKYDDITVWDGVLIIPYEVNMLWNFGPIETNREIFPRNCTVTINFDFKTSETPYADYCGILALYYDITNESVTNKSDSSFAIHYSDYGSYISFGIPNNQEIEQDIWYNYKVILTIEDGEMGQCNYYIDDVLVESSTLSGPFVNMVGGSLFCGFIGFMPNGGNGTTRLRNMYIAYA